MADGEEATALERAPLTIAGAAWTGFGLDVQQGLGVGKLRIFGPDSNRTFKRIVGHEPPKPRTYKEARGLGFAWLAPGEWLITGEERLLSSSVVRLSVEGGNAVLATDVTHGRVAFILSGYDARVALAAHCPLDLSAENFPVGATARSLLGEIVMFIARPPDVSNEPKFQVIVDQTMASYAARRLAAAAKFGASH